MLKIEVVLEEQFDETTQTFITKESVDLQMQHSLVSLSKWESKWEKPFLGDAKHTSEELLDYIRCMVIGNVSEGVLDSLSQTNIQDISNYINSSQTATWISDSDSKAKKQEVVTSELVYYWMVAHNIPFECETWHFNRLMTLIRVCNAKNQPEKKKARSEILQSNKALNEARRAKYNTRG